MHGHQLLEAGVVDRAGQRHGCRYWGEGEGAVQVVRATGVCGSTAPLWAWSSSLLSDVIELD